MSPASVGYNASFAAIYSPNTWMFMGFSYGFNQASESTSFVQGALIYHTNLGELYG